MGPSCCGLSQRSSRGHRAQLADQHRRADLRRGRAQRLDRGGRVAARHVVLGLQLLAVARRELEAEVGEPLRPRAGAAELRRGVDGVVAEDRVAVLRRRAGAEQLGAAAVAALLEPHLVDGLAPAREDADGVGAREHLVEVLEQRAPRRGPRRPPGGRRRRARRRARSATIAPSAPSATTWPSKSGSPRRTVRRSPSAVTSSRPATEVARLPLRSPEPWVAVATAPATEMCGSDARLASASPWRSSSAASAP